MRECDVNGEVLAVAFGDGVRIDGVMEGLIRREEGVVYGEGLVIATDRRGEGVVGSSLVDVRGVWLNCWQHFFSSIELGCGAAEAAPVGSPTLRHRPIDALPLTLKNWWAGALII